MNFCYKCGNPTIEGAKFCFQCGAVLSGEAPAPPRSASDTSAYQPPYQQQSTPAYQPPYQQQNQPPYQQPYQQPYQPSYNAPRDIVRQLSVRIKIQAVIWLVVACIQFILGIIFIDQAVHKDESILMGILFILVGILNTVFGIKNIIYSTDILRNPTLIIDKYRPVGGIVGTLIYNILFGGLIGVAGSIYAFVVRGFVMSHEAEFARIEEECTKD